MEAAQTFAHIIMPIEVMKRILYALVLLLFLGCKGGSYQKSLEEIDTLADSYPAQARVFLNRADSNENKAYYKLLDVKIGVSQKLNNADYISIIDECARAPRGALYPDDGLGQHRPGRAGNAGRCFRLHHQAVGQWRAVRQDRDGHQDKQCKSCDSANPKFTHCRHLPLWHSRYRGPRCSYQCARLDYR